MIGKMLLPAASLSVLTAACGSTPHTAALAQPDRPAPLQSRSTPTTNSPSTGPAPESTTMTPGPTAAGLPSSASSTACRSSDLEVTQTSGQGTAGSREADFLLTATHTSRCDITGWPRLTATGSSGRRLAVTSSHTGTSHHVVLRPGHPAHFTARVSLVACNTNPVVPAALDVTLPGQITPLRVTASELPICPGGPIMVSPLQP